MLSVGTRVTTGNGTGKIIRVDPGPVYVVQLDEPIIDERSGRPVPFVWCYASELEEG
jgi:hypothetical protein